MCWQEMLNHYYKDANIEYKCCKCKTMRNCIRKLDVWKLPPVLILHLNRYIYTLENYDGDDSDNYIVIWVIFSSYPFEIQYSIYS